MQAIDTISPIHRISVAQFHRMIDAGVFATGDRIELIDGEMRDMPPIGPSHGSCTDVLNMQFASKLSGKAIVRVQGALVLDDGTEVYPDVLILKQRGDWYRHSNPAGADVFLVIEVAASSLPVDLGIKLLKYARSGVQRYWVVDLKNRTLHDYRDPDRFASRYRRLDSVADGALSLMVDGIEIRIDIGDLFPT